MPVANSLQQLQCQLGNAGCPRNLGTARLAPATLGTPVYPPLPRGDGDRGMRGMDHQAGIFRCPLGKHGEVETRSCSKIIGNVEESPLSLWAFGQRRRWAVE